MGVAYELDASAATVIGGALLAGGVSRIAGIVIGIILGGVTSGIVILKAVVLYREIFKVLFIDQQRQNKRREVQSAC